MFVAPKPPLSSSHPRIFGITELFSLWRRRRQLNEELESLDAHMLADIGLTREELHRERPVGPWLC